MFPTSASSLFARELLITKFEGIVMKLKMMHMQFTLNNLFFNIFFCDFIQLNYKPSNFALAILPYAAGQRVKMCIHKFILKNQWKNQFLAMQVHVIKE